MCDTGEIRAVLQRFQEGYNQRNVEKLDEFMQLFIPGKDLEVIGTGATQFGTDEWCSGLEQTRELVESDWKGWGDLALEIENARIFCRGEVGWLSTYATVTMDLDKEKGYAGYVEYAKEILDQPELSAEEKILELLRGSSNTLFEYQRGEHFVWPLRFTAVLVKEDGQWRFHQMQFSHPNTRFPDERILSK